MDDFLKTLRDAGGAGQSAENPLAGLLGGLLGGASHEEDGVTDSVSGIAEQAGITPNIAQAVMALLAGQLASRQAGDEDKAKSARLGKLLELARGGSGGR